MRRTKQVIAVVVVATALCADRSIMAAPASTTPTPSLARSIAARLTSSLRQTVAPVRMVSVRTNEVARQAQLPVCEAATGVRAQLSPFQFRLPPPSL